MTRWNHEKRRTHPHGPLSSLERMLGKIPVHRSPVRRGRTVVRIKGPAPEGSMTHTKM